MSKTNANSAGLLDDADESLRRLDWILFQQEQAKVLYDVGDGFVSDWIPGKPLHSYPSRVVVLREDGFGGLSNVVELNGNYPRPMYQIIDDGADDVHTHCYDCEVSWAWMESVNCWVCGKVSPYVVGIQKQQEQMNERREARIRAQAEERASGRVFWDFEHNDDSGQVVVNVEQGAYAEIESRLIQQVGAYTYSIGPITATDPESRLASNTWLDNYQAYLAEAFGLDRSMLSSRLWEGANQDYDVPTSRASQTRRGDLIEWLNNRSSRRMMLSYPRQPGRYEARRIYGRAWTGLVEVDEWAESERIREEKAARLGTCVVDGVMYVIEFPAEYDTTPPIPLPEAPLPARNLGQEVENSFQSRLLTERRRPRSL